MSGLYGKNIREIEVYANSLLTICENRNVSNY
jgi:hypothetical protein